ncbi:hypothetical protein [Vibrio phage VpKK5]|uniref:hypothetical protein n=1 Tax=Vibrio phage VpKK5 TaxID=1538804 RepID=UPI0004F5A817|nr:hypothetical protein VC55_gp03 [Vibrio phage VpKK5]AIM40587.1 hypothetical protein [Vibrio phage VpKK5]
MSYGFSFPNHTCPSTRSDGTNYHKERNPNSKTTLPADWRKRTGRNKGVRQSDNSK